MKRSRRLAPSLHALVTGLAAVLCVFCIAGISSFDGAGDDNWGSKPGTYSRIVAEVLEIDPGDVRAGEQRVVLRPIATLSGGFDTGRHPKLKTQMWTSQAPGTTSIKRAPPRGALIMAVLFHTRDERGWVISSDGSTFMPTNASSVEVLTGLDDPKMQQTVERVQAARARSRAEAEKASEDKPR